VSKEEFSSEGCNFGGVTATNVKCECTHLTDFFTSFANTGFSVLANSNIFLVARVDLFAKVDPLDNLGVIFAVVLLIILLIVYKLLNKCDENSFKSSKIGIIKAEIEGMIP
jgi:hypothetical protein